MKGPTARLQPECIPVRAARLVHASWPLPFQAPSPMRHLKALFALTAAAALTACGGGGGDSSPPPPAPAPGPAVGTNGTLQTSVAAANYGSDTRRLDAFNELNAVRLGAGAGLLAQSAVLDTTALDHSNYLTVNGFNSADSAHDETSGLADFTG